MAPQKDRSPEPPAASLEAETYFFRRRATMTPNTPMPKSASVEGSGTDTGWHFFGVLPEGPQPF